MVNFQQTPKPRNYLSRREQWRLLLMVMTLGLVVILMMEARKPQRWHWLTAAGGGDAQADAAAAAGEPIDTRVETPAAGQEIPGTFRSPAPVPEQAEVDATGRYFPGVKPKYLQFVRDDKTFGPQEQAAWFNLLGILKRTDQQTLERRSSGRVTFAQLFKQSGEYRGDLVTIRGRARRANLLPTPKNEHGIKEFHRVWVFPDDNPSSPMVVYCLYLPEGFPTGMEINAQVEITGFYFKRWVFKAVDSLRRAPTLVARTVRWEKPAPPTPEPAPAGPGTLLIVIGMAAVLSVLITVYVFTRSRSPRSDEAEQPPNLDVLRDAEYPSETPVDQQPRE